MNMSVLSKSVVFHQLKWKKLIVLSQPQFKLNNFRFSLIFFIFIDKPTDGHRINLDNLYNIYFLKNILTKYHVRQVFEYENLAKW